jgi:hypothetical protein
MASDQFKENTVGSHAQAIFHHLALKFFDVSRKVALQQIEMIADLPTKPFGERLKDLERRVLNLQRVSVGMLRHFPRPTLFIAAV